MIFSRADLLALALLCRAPAAPPPEGFVALDGIELEIRYATPNNFTGGPLPGYCRPSAWLRTEAAAALARVQADLATEGLALRVYDAYRPIRATKAMVAWARRTGRRDLLRDGYIAARSNHNRGIAIDLTIIDVKTGDPLDMGTPFDSFTKAAHHSSANKNHLRLRRAMEAHGFTAYPQEWWHYTFKTRGAPAIDEPY